MIAENRIIYQQIETMAYEISEAHEHIDDRDALILAMVEMFVNKFDDFLENTLMIAHTDGETYKVEISLHDFQIARQLLLRLIYEIGIILTTKYPNIAQSFFIDRVEAIKEQIKDVSLTGRVLDIYNLQSDYYLLYTLVEGGILTHQLESALKTFEGLTPDYHKLYMSGLKSLGTKFKTGRLIFDIMTEHGHGVPMSVDEVSKVSKKDKRTVRKGIEQMMEGAGHLIRVVQRGTVDTYYIPEQFRRLHVR